MNEYAVLIFGEGYRIAEGDEPLQEQDFYVWRCVHAENDAEAKQIAMQMVRDDETLNSSVRNLPNNLTTIRVEEVKQGFGDLTPPGSGYIFCGSNEDDQVEPPRGFLAKISSWFERK